MSFTGCLVVLTLLLGCWSVHYVWSMFSWNEILWDSLSRPLRSSFYQLVRDSGLIYLSDWVHVWRAEDDEEEEKRMAVVLLGTGMALLIKPPSGWSPPPHLFLIILSMVDLSQKMTRSAWPFHKKWNELYRVPFRSRKIFCLLRIVV